MAKKVEAYVKLQVPAGQAKPTPPVGPALGQHGVNIMEFCKTFNAQTQNMEPGLPIPCVITVYQDRSFTFITKTPPASVLLRKIAGIEKGSDVPNAKKVGTVTREQLEEVAAPEDAGPEHRRRRRRGSHHRRKRSQHGTGIGGGALMAQRSRRLKAIRERIDRGKLYDVSEALALLKDMASVKFSESVDVSVNLGVDPRKSDQVVRGSTVMPNGIGKESRVAVFAQGTAAEEAREAGADVVGMDDLAEQVKAGNLDFDIVIAAPDAMRVVGKLGRILGPRGLMPNPKVGTVTPDVTGAVRNAKAGQVQYRTDRAGIIHCTIGKVAFEIDALKQNLDALLDDLKKAKPSTSKGVYMRKVTLSTTMGPGLGIDKATLGL